MRSARAAAGRHARLLWWLTAGGPPLLGVTLLMLEPHNPPALAATFDLSEVLFNLSSALTVVMGGLMAVATIYRLEGELRRASSRTELPRSEVLHMTREASLRGAWMLLVASSLIVLGLTLLVLPEDALVVYSALKSL